MTQHPPVDVWKEPSEGDATETEREREVCVCGGGLTDYEHVAKITLRWFRRHTYSDTKD